MSAYRGDRLGQPLVFPDIAVYTEDEPSSVPLWLVLPVCLLPQVRGGVRGMEHCPGQPHLCTLFCCLHQQLPRPGVSRLPLSQATALLGSRRAAASRKERTRVLGVPRWVLSLQHFLTSRGRVAQEMQIKVTRVKRQKQGWIRCLHESFKLIFSPSFSALEAGFFHFLFWRLALQTQQHGLKAAFGTGLEEIL